LDAPDRRAVAAGLLGGFAAVTGATLVYFAFHGALRDLVFYTWTYNLRYYGPEVTTVDRALSALRPLGLLWRAYRRSCWPERPRLRFLP